MRFRLLTLVIATAIGPPLLATAWATRESLLSAHSRAEVYIPASASPRMEAKLRAQAARRQEWHSLAGAGAVVSYPVAVILLASVLRTMRHWWEPPTKTPRAWAAVAVSALAATFVLVYFMTFPPPWGYISWAAYFASDGQPRPSSVGK
jgi:hypothetical protein